MATTTPTLAPTAEASTSPVVKAPGAHHYLLCLDPEDTEASQTALEYAKSRIAHRGDLVVLLSVIQHPLPFPVDGWATAGVPSIYSNAVNRDENEKLDAELVKAQTDRLEKAAKGFAEGVQVETRAVFSSAGPKVAKIVEMCENWDCDIIIVGRRKRGALQRWLGSGSISTALLTNTNYSVLVLR